jgi:LmbE family N-acetylglucosaminyl deacetylase
MTLAMMDPRRKTARMRALLVLAIASCGDNALPDGVPLGPAAELVVVAHQDDDLLFMQPDVYEAVRRGKGVTNVYVTAGNANKGVDYAQSRYAGLMAGYGALVGDDSWFCGWVEIADHIAEHCRLEAGKLSLVFLGYPDGGKDVIAPTALLRLWEGTVTNVQTVAERTARYDQAGLIATVGEIISTTKPNVIRTLEVASLHGRDHEDHMGVGALTVLAIAATNADAEIISYRGYNTEDEQANNLEPVFARSANVVSRYDACASGCADCGQACKTMDPSHVTWLHRRYAIAMRRSATGQLRLADQCVTADSSGTLSLVDCASAPRWTFTPSHALQSGAQCVEILPTGELVAGHCGDGAVHAFFLDDDGHLWLGTPPPPTDNMDYAHMLCMIAAGGRPRGTLCGDMHAMAPVWELVNPAVTTPRASLGMVHDGRAVRLGDVTGDGKADLCEIRTTGLVCATGNGDGTFGAPKLVSASLAGVDPDSLAIGDIDGDGRPDACGRDAMGILCATAASGFVASRFTAALATADASTLAAVDTSICGLAPTGVACAAQGGDASLVSPWPVAGSALWPADLDGDQRADWCAVPPGATTGPACAVDRDRDLTTDGAPWAYSQAGMIENTDGLTADTTALADVDGDGRADLCTISGNRVSCALAQDHAFGPRATLAILPAPATALWLGDLDGDGRADACTSDGTTITCALAP